VDGRDVPSYELFLGGGNYIGGGRYGERVIRIPAKKVPQAVLRILEVYRRERREGEPFLDFLDRFGAKNFEPLLAEFRQVGPVREELDTYLDWGSTVLFKVIRGEGECAV
jgi:sulfite reductase beta subunit-like hemoprotein